MTNLRVATAEEKIARDRLTASAWGDKLTVPQYLAREQRLRGHRFAAEHMTTWLLEDESGVLASCETFANEALIGGKSAGVVHAVASVFTEESKRGQGHASDMMRRLVAKLAEDPRSIASTLYSDVGAPIYARHGYAPRPAFDRVFPVRPNAHAAELVDRADLSRILPHFDSFAPDELTVRATVALVDWHLERERAYADLIGGPTASSAGALVAGGSAAWVADAKRGELYVLYVSAENTNAVRALLDAAIDVAARASLSAVRVWETPLLFAANLGERGPRAGSLPMIVPLRADLAADAWRAIPRLTWV